MPSHFITFTPTLRQVACAYFYSQILDQHLRKAVLNSNATEGLESGINTVFTRANRLTGRSLNPKCQGPMWLSLSSLLSL